VLVGGVANRLCMAPQPLTDNTDNVTRRSPIVCCGNSSRFICFASAVVFAHLVWGDATTGGLAARLHLRGGSREMAFLQPLLHENPVLLELGRNLAFRIRFNLMKACRAIE
jgi:hypothetical protein